MNGSMFLPRLPEREMPGTIGHACHQVNSMLEWVDEVALEHLHETPDEQEEEGAQQFETPVSADYSHHSGYEKNLMLHRCCWTEPQRWARYTNSLREAHFEISTPPPEV
jgi:hypothetical protein